MLVSWRFYTVLLQFCYWSVERNVVPKAPLLEQVSKPDSVACPTLSLLVWVQVVVWLSEGSSVMSRERKERYCDAKRPLPGSVLGTETGERVTVGCCEVKRLLDMWGVPTQ
jgi:hypothetical protein